MWGPGIAALVSLVIFRKTHRRSILFWGNAKIRSACFYLVPMLLLAFANPPANRFLFGAVRNPEGHQVNPVLFLWVTVLSFCWALGEELGWRGFLQDALRPLCFSNRFLVLGVMWAFWHFTNYIANRSWEVVAISLSIFFPAIVLLSFVIGVAVERSRSLCVAVTLHAWIDIAIRLRTERTFIVCGISILFWILLLWRWPQNGIATKH